MRTHMMIPALLLLSVGLAACAHQPNANLESARSNFSTLQSDPQANELAALETKEAKEWLDKTEKAYREDADEQKVDQLAYLTNRRIDVAKQTIALRSAEADLKDVSTLRTQARLDARNAEIRKLQESLNARQTERGTLVTFGDVLFDFNKAQLKSSAYPDIAKLAQFLQEHPERQVIVEGHTDSVGSASYNWSLSERRANAVRTALVRAGVEPSRIVVQGYGEEHPVADNASESGRAQNRRVEVTISHDDKPVAPRSRTGA